MCAPRRYNYLSVTLLMTVMAFPAIAQDKDRGVDVSDGKPTAVATYHYLKGDGHVTHGRFVKDTLGQVNSGETYIKKKIGDMYIYVAVNEVPQATNRAAPTHETKTSNQVSAIAQSKDQGVDASDAKPAAVETYHFHEGNDQFGTGSRFDRDTPDHVDSEADLKSKTGKTYIMKKIDVGAFGSSVDHKYIDTYVAVDSAGFKQAVTQNAPTQEEKTSDPGSGTHVSAVQQALAPTPVVATQPLGLAPSPAAPIQSPVSDVSGVAKPQNPLDHTDPTGPNSVSDQRTLHPDPTDPLSQPQSLSQEVIHYSVILFIILSIIGISISAYVYARGNKQTAMGLILGGLLGLVAWAVCFGIAVVLPSLIADSILFTRSWMIPGLIIATFVAIGIGPKARKTPTDPPVTKTSGAPKDSRNSNTPAPVPWDYRCKGIADNTAFFQAHRDTLPKLFELIKDKGKDPILLLVSFEQEKWCALLALLYKRPETLHLTPEMFSAGKPKISNNGYCDVYNPPEVAGQAMLTGVFGLNREWLISEFCWVKGIPPMFISLIKAEHQPAGQFTVVVLAAGGMRVEYLPVLAPVATPVTQAPSTHSGINRELKEAEPSSKHYLVFGLDLSPSAARKLSFEQASKQVTGLKMVGDRGDWLESAKGDDYSVLLYFNKGGGLFEAVINPRTTVQFLGMNAPEPERVWSQIGYRKVEDLGQKITWTDGDAKIVGYYGRPGSLNEIHYVIPEKPATVADEAAVAWRQLGFFGGGRGCVESARIVVGNAYSKETAVDNIIQYVKESWKEPLPQGFWLVKADDNRSLYFLGYDVRHESIFQAVTAAMQKEGRALSELPHAFRLAPHELFDQTQIGPIHIFGVLGGGATVGTAESSASPPNTAPSADAPVTTLPANTPKIVGAFSSNRGSGLARGNHPTAPAPLSAVPAPVPSDYRTVGEASLCSSDTHSNPPADRSAKLLEAAKEGNLDAVNRLLAAGADKGAKDFGNRTVLHHAAQNGRLAVVQCLLAAGADKEAKADMDWTVLQLAATEGHAAMVQCLLAAGADKEAKNADGSTALCVAAAKGHLSIVECLLAANANKDVRDGLGSPVLNLAAANGHLAVVRSLLTAGANTDTKDGGGCTALERAAIGGHEDIVECLEAAGAVPSQSFPSIKLRRAVTSVHVVADVGDGNKLYIRGDGPGMNWDRGALMDCVDHANWKWLTQTAMVPFAYKTLVNDLTWSVGENFKAEIGVENTVTPLFGEAAKPAPQPAAIRRRDQSPENHGPDKDASNAGPRSTDPGTRIFKKSGDGSLHETVGDDSMIPALFSLAHSEYAKVMRAASANSITAADERALAHCVELLNKVIEIGVQRGEPYGLRANMHFIDAQIRQDRSTLNRAESDFNQALALGASDPSNHAMWRTNLQNVRMLRTMI